MLLNLAAPRRQFTALNPWSGEMKRILVSMRRKRAFLTGLMILIVLAGWRVWQWQPNVQPYHHRIAIIKQGGKVIERIDLDAVSEPREIRLPGKYNETVRVEKGRIRFQEADCPDKICVKTGWLEKPGDTAVCLPNRAVVTIVDD